MERLVVNASVFTQLPGWDQEFEVCDESGRTLGYFLSPQFHQELLYAWAKTQFSDDEREEARRELQQVGGLSTADAIEFLQGLAGARGASA
jgi:hypothetical protein